MPGTENLKEEVPPPSTPEKLRREAKTRAREARRKETRKGSSFTKRRLFCRLTWSDVMSEHKTWRSRPERTNVATSLVWQLKCKLH